MSATCGVLNNRQLNCQPAQTDNEENVKLPHCEGNPRVTGELPSYSQQITSYAEPYINNSHLFIGNTTLRLRHTLDNISSTKWIVTPYVLLHIYLFNLAIECCMQYTEYHVYPVVLCWNEYVIWTKFSSLPAPEFR